MSLYLKETCNVQRKFLNNSVICRLLCPEPMFTFRLPWWYTVYRFQLCASAVVLASSSCFFTSGVSWKAHMLPLVLHLTEFAKSGSQYLGDMWFCPMTGEESAPVVATDSMFLISVCWPFAIALDPANALVILFWNHPCLVKNGGITI